MNDRRNLVNDRVKIKSLTYTQTCLFGSAESLLIKSDGVG